MKYALVFLAVAALDVAWARYTRAVGGRKATRAAVWAVAIYALGALVTIEYVREPWLLVPAVAGAFIGTWIGTVRW